MCCIAQFFFFFFGLVKFFLCVCEDSQKDFLNTIAWLQLLFGFAVTKKNMSMRPLPTLSRLLKLSFVVLTHGPPRLFGMFCLLICLQFIIVSESLPHIASIQEEGTPRLSASNSKPPNLLDAPPAAPLRLSSGPELVRVFKRTKLTSTRKSLRTQWQHAIIAQRTSHRIPIEQQSS